MTKTQKDSEHRRRVRKYAEEGIDFYGTYGRYEIYIPQTYEASCKLGRGTRWCTAASNEESSRSYFERYSSEGPLYVLINRDDPEEKYQIHFYSGQFMDINDARVDEDKLTQIMETSPELLMFEKEANYNRDGVLSLELDNMFKAASIQAKISRGDAKLNMNAKALINWLLYYVPKEVDGESLPERDHDDKDIWILNGKSYLVLSWGEAIERLKSIIDTAEWNEEDPIENIIWDLSQKSYFKFEDYIDYDAFKERFTANSREIYQRAAESMSEEELAEFLYWHDALDSFGNGVFSRWGTHEPDYSSCTLSKDRLVELYVNTCMDEHGNIFNGETEREKKRSVQFAISNRTTFDMVCREGLVDWYGVAENIVITESRALFLLLAGKPGDFNGGRYEYNLETFFIIPQ